jgi:hypothetical protein
MLPTVPSPVCGGSPIQWKTTSARPAVSGSFLPLDRQCVRSASLLLRMRRIRGLDLMLRRVRLRAASGTLPMGPLVFPVHRVLAWWLVSVCRALVVRFLGQPLRSALRVPLEPTPRRVLRCVLFVPTRDHLLNLSAAGRASTARSTAAPVPSSSIARRVSRAPMGRFPRWARRRAPTAPRGLGRALGRLRVRRVRR